MFRFVKSLVMGVVLAAGLAGVAQAGHGYDCGYQAPQPCHYKTITTYEYIQKPIYSYVTKYDHCGHPYQVKVLSYQTVQVPVQKLIKVCY